MNYERMSSINNAAGIKFYLLLRSRGRCHGKIITDCRSYVALIEESSRFRRHHDRTRNTFRRENARLYTACVVWTPRKFGRGSSEHAIHDHEDMNPCDFCNSTLCFNIKRKKEKGAFANVHKWKSVNRSRDCHHPIDSESKLLTFDQCRCVALRSF